ncbi:MAG TPA: hypothetical protein VFI75_02835 [Candidatus Acidoferrum sp.]|nr:hypothetical protein [Candidatus Acidoferrum sp.]
MGIKAKTLAQIVVGFVLGLGVCMAGPTILKKAWPVNQRDWVERERVTSPDGRFDAVIVSESWGGAAGGFEFYLHIIPRGKPAPIGGDHALLQAYKLDCERLAWNKAHLLEVHYCYAGIESYRNLWALDEIEDVGPTGERDYYVEVRLFPSTADFSLLTPDGKFLPHPIQ